LKRAIIYVGFDKHSVVNKYFFCMKLRIKYISVQLCRLFSAVSSYYQCNGNTI